MNEIYKYYTIIQDAIDKIDTFIDELENDRTDEYDSQLNYSDMINNLELAKRNLQYYANAHKFFRMNKENFIQDLGYSFGERVEKLHTIKAFETPLNIAIQYSVTLDSILLKNSITVNDFTPGRVIRIDINSPDIMKIYNEIMTFGDQSSDLVFGSDLPCEITVQSGDLAVLNNTATLKQGITNLLTTKLGSYPMQKDFGVNVSIGREFPKELRDSLITVQTSEAIEGDRRIRSIDNFTLENDFAIVKARTINNQTINIE